MADTEQSTTPEASASGESEILRLSTKDKGEPIKMVELFEIDDKPYSVPLKPSPTVGLKYLHILKHEGQQEAAYYMLSTMLGEAGYEALMNYEQLTEEQYNFVLGAALRIATGKNERPKGNRNRPAGPSGRRR
jgi:hypothetical protein